MLQQTQDIEIDFILVLLIILYSLILPTKHQIYSHYVLEEFVKMIKFILQRNNSMFEKILNIELGKILTPVAHGGNLDINNYKTKYLKYKKKYMELKYILANQ
jgi:hypothetical protein